MYTPWGPSDFHETKTRGVHVVGTPSHGGVMVSEGFAKRHLTQAAIDRGLRYGDYLCYEEDCDVSIVVFELPELFPDEDTEKVKRSLSLWNADYLLERGIQPVEPQYTEYREWKQTDKMRKAQDPNLITCAWGDWYTHIPDVDMVETADGKQHFVTAESYETHKMPLNLLSDCIVYDKDQSVKNEL
jgi:hypothetical protein